MKYSMSVNTMKNSNALFYEQVETITSLFQNWNECEQTVVLYALLRGIPFQNLKFLQLCIEYNLQNITHGELKTLEQNANNPNYLRNLFNGCIGNDLAAQIIENDSLSVKNRLLCQENPSYGNFTSLQKQISSDGHLNYLIDGLVHGNDKMQEYCKNGYHDSNSDYFRGVVLPELLHCLPLLRMGNEEAKNVYLSLVPQAVSRPGCEDLCQQLLSYLLIHPAVTGEDRRSLTQYLHHLEEHISLGGGGGGDHSPPPPPPAAVATPTTTAAASGASDHHAPHRQINKPHNNSSAWSLHDLQRSDARSSQQGKMYTSWSNFEYQHNQNHQHRNDKTTTTANTDNSAEKEEFRKTIGKNLAFNNKPLDQQSADSAYDDDSQLSFSKNGTEIDDALTEQLNSAVETTPSVDFFSQNCKLYNVTAKASQESPVKTQRSSSLTPTSDDGLFRSNENLSLLTLMQKPRSYSLSSEHNALLSPHSSSLVSSGSESRLDDFKNTHHNGTGVNGGGAANAGGGTNGVGGGPNGKPKNPGMSNIAQWLKSLRLHKYIWLFSNTTYDEMMGITEDYLARLGVTKGARHKLYLSIQRLKERHAALCSAERDLSAARAGPGGGGAPPAVAVFAALEEMRAVIVSPIKPQRDDDIVRQFLKLIDMVSSLINTSLLHGVQDEESLALYFWILDRAIASEAFAPHAALLRNMKFKTVKTNQYQNKHHQSGGVVGGAMVFGNGGVHHQQQQQQHHLYMGGRRNSDFSNASTNAAAARNAKTRWNQYTTNRTNRVAAPPQWGANNQMVPGGSGYPHPPYVGVGGNMQLYNNYINNNTHHKQFTNGGGGGRIGHHQHQNGQPHMDGSGHHGQDKYTKSSSYPNFHMSKSELSFEPHRHSLTSLVAPSLGNVQKLTQKTKTVEQKTTSSSSKSSVVEINNRLESLCLQMTEQAIE